MLVLMKATKASSIKASPMKATKAILMKASPMKAMKMNPIKAMKARPTNMMKAMPASVANPYMDLCACVEQVLDVVYTGVRANEIHADVAHVPS